MTCPVALPAATIEAGSIRFNPINPRTNNRIKMQTVDAGTAEEVSRGELVKSCRIARDRYVLVDEDGLDAVKPGATRALDCGKVVPRASIDRLCRGTPHPPVPSGKTGVADLV